MQKLILNKIKLLEENIGEELCDLGAGRVMTLKA